MLGEEINIVFFPNWLETLRTDGILVEYMFDEKGIETFDPFEATEIFTEDGNIYNPVIGDRILVEVIY